MDGQTDNLPHGNTVLRYASRGKNETQTYKKKYYHYYYHYYQYLCQSLTMHNAYTGTPLILNSLITHVT